MPTLDSVRFDTKNWQPVSRDRWTAAWQNEHGDDLVFLFEYGLPGIPATGDVRPALLESLTRISGGQIHLLAVDRRPVAGVGAVVALLRARRGTGWTYGAAVMLPFARFTYSLLLVAGEHGVTGVREAMGAYWSYLKGSDPTTSAPPEQEQILDAVLPDHPQARVRTYLDELLGSLALGSDLATAVTWPPTMLPTSIGSLQVRDGAILRRGTGSRLVGRFPLTKVRGVRLEAGWSRAAIAVSVGAGVGAVLAVALLSGWWAIGCGALAVLIAVVSSMNWQSRTIRIDTPLGEFGWKTFEDRTTAAAFCDYAASQVPQREERPCPPSS